METINNECYVSLEVAKLLKQAGFDWEGTAYYQHGVFYPYSVDRERLVVMNQSSAPSYMEQYSAPTIEVAQRWLREVKGIDIEISAHVGMLHKKVYMPYISFYKPYVITENDKHFGITQEEAKEWVIQNKFPLVYKDEIYPELPAHQWFDTYEEAQEAGIKKVLEIILEKGE